jgi:AraC-like DNA-binding protein
MDPFENPETDADNEIAWVDQLRKAAHLRLGSFDLTVKELASDMTMSERSFFRKVKELTGLTPARYVSNERFQRALLLLQTKKVKSLKQLSYKVGFRQVNHFSKKFKEKFGKSPTDYL